MHLYEAAPHAGGRCRSFYDELLGTTIDNGNHLLLGANRAALDYLETVGGLPAMTVIAPASIPFIDLRTGQAWSLRPNIGRFPWWLFSASRGVPGTRLHDRLGGLRLLAARTRSTVSGALATTGPMYERFWEPMATAVLNTNPSVASAGLLRRSTLAMMTSGELGLRPCFAASGLSASFVYPALCQLKVRGVHVRFGWRARALEWGGDRVVGLDFGKQIVAVGPGDALILAVPPEAASALLPALRLPTSSSPIVNLHFRLPSEAALPGGLPFVGLIGGTAQWLFIHGEILSATISAASSLVNDSSAAIAAPVWDDICGILGRAPMPPYRVIKERRATMAHTPDQLALRPKQGSISGNLVLAGDWVDTGLPATIESAVLSGRTAVRLSSRR